MEITLPEVGWKAATAAVGVVVVLSDFTIGYVLDHQDDRDTKQETAIAELRQELGKLELEVVKIQAAHGMFGGNDGHNDQ